MSRVLSGPRAAVPAVHLRRDGWWSQPLAVVLALGGFFAYATWAALQNGHYYVAPYLSPFYSPCVTQSCAHRTFGLAFPDVIVPILGVLSPAFVILWGPGMMRLTCYSYRKAYYRSFWLSPVACGIPDAQRRRYTGEQRFPLVLQNLHRYFWYPAALFILILIWDAVLAFRFPDGFGIGVGTIVMWINVILLAGYTFSCHSLRHMCGGHVDVFSRAPARHGLWRLISGINERHTLYAWVSLASVGLTDVYIRLVSMGVIRDFRIL